MTITAYHFIGDTLRDGSAIPPIGEWLEHDGPLVLCESGLHYSLCPLDALMYAPGSTICLVDCDGEIIESRDKGVCSRRRILDSRDITDELRVFARWCVLEVVGSWNPPSVVLEFLHTGDDSIRSAATSAARAAAWAATSDASDASDAAAAGAAAREKQKTKFTAIVNEVFKSSL